MKYNSLILFVIAFLVFANVLNAQHPKHGRHQRHAKHPEMRKEMRQYAKESILPTLRAQRLKLDNYLTAQEKAEIASLREVFKIEKKAMHQKHKEMRKAKENGTLNIETAKAEMKALREKHHANVEKLRAIAQKYEAQMQKLKEEISPNIENWKSNMEKIASKYVSAEELEMVKRKAGKQWKMRGVAFLLMPTEAPKEEKRKQDASEEAQVYPNPAQETQKLTIQTKEAGLVKINLFDRQGNLVQTVFEGNKSAGEHTFEVNTSKLSTGNYTYQITTPTSKTTKKLIIKK